MELNCSEPNPPVEELASCGLLPRLVDFLHVSNCPQLQFEAAWTLTNVASGTCEQTAAVVEAGAVPIFVQLLQSPSEDVREQVGPRLTSVGLGERHSWQTPAAKGSIRLLHVISDVIRLI